MKAKLEHNYTENIVVNFEHSIEIDGMSYLVIFGTHINGGFICVPNHNWGCEASDYINSAGYNAKKLIEVGASERAAKAIAEYIDNWCKNKKLEEHLCKAELAGQNGTNKRLYRTTHTR